jgi:hypothetical protein
MIVALIACFVVCCAQAIILWYCIRRIDYLVTLVEQIDEQTEESLDVLNTCFAGLSKAANTELLSDEPVIKEVVHDIQLARNAVLWVAHKITSHTNEIDKV